MPQQQSFLIYQSLNNHCPPHELSSRNLTHIFKEVEGTRVSVVPGLQFPAPQKDPALVAQELRLELQFVMIEQFCGQQIIATLDTFLVSLVHISAVSFSKFRPRFKHWEKIHRYSFLNDQIQHHQETRLLLFC